MGNDPNISDQQHRADEADALRAGMREILSFENEEWSDEVTDAIFAIARRTLAAVSGGAA